MLQGIVEEGRLSPQQEHVWSLQRHNEPSPYRAQCAILVEGSLDPDILRKAFARLVERHEILRTAFRQEGETVRQSPLEAAGDFVWSDVQDLSGLPSGEQQAVVDNLFDEALRLPFDFERGRLLRVTFLTLSPTAHVLIISLPALCADERSISNLAHEVSRSYQECLRVESQGDEPMQYSLVADWLNEMLVSDDTEACRQYWQQREVFDPHVVRLPFEKQHPADSTFEPRAVTHPGASRLTERLEPLLRAYQVSASDVLLACWHVLLWRLVGEPEIVTGVAFNGRPDKELEEALGLFARALPVRSHLEANLGFSELLMKINETTREIYGWQECFSWEQAAVSAKRSPAGAQFFSACFDFEEPTAKHSAASLTFSIIKAYACVDRFKIKLSATLTGESLITRLHYDASCFNEADVESLASQFHLLLEDALANPDAAIGELNMLSMGERQRILFDFNRTQVDYPQRPVHQLFEEQVERTPDQVACALKDESLTYAELNARANQLAHYLRQSGVRPGARVGIFLPHSFDMVTALLATLKAGGAYVPLEPMHPAGRILYMIEDAQPALILTNLSLSRSLAPGISFLALDSEWPMLAASYSSLNPGIQLSPEEMAYVIYTSGSTGSPKGVLIRHRSLSNYICWARDHYLQGDALDFALYSSISFDLTVTSIFTPLITGNRILIYPTDGQHSPLPEILEDNQVGVLKLTPSHLALIKERDNRSCGVRRLIVGGEALTTDLAREVEASFGGSVEIYNEYGPTEATVGCMIYRFQGEREERATVPIGRPAANTQIYLLDERLEPVAEHAQGEIYIGGEGVAAGYLNEEEMTVARFMENPYIEGRRMYRSGDVGRRLRSGEIEYMGRMDEQVKYHGYRVELNEIRMALNGHSQVRDSVVQVQEDAGGNKVMVAYYVSRQEVDSSELRAFMAEKIIEETIPNIFVHLKKLPLTLNGKVNLSALPTLEEARAQVKRSFVAPRTSVEDELAGIWSEVLGIGQVGIEDNFFQLGGHSLIATQVLSRVREFFNVELPLRSLFEAPTPKDLAVLVEAAIRTGEGIDAPPIKPYTRDEPLPLSFAQERLWLIDQMEPGSALYNVPGALRLSGKLNVAALEQSLNEIVRRHEVLRTTYAIRDLSPVQIIAPHQTLSLNVVNLGDMAEELREEEALRLAAEAANRPFDLSKGPLLRVELLRLAEREHILVFTLHHIVSDGWSMGILIRELAALYEAFSEGHSSPLAELEVQYADFARWQREWLQGAALEKQLTYWRRQLAGVPPQLKLPTDRPRPATQTFNGATERFTLPAALSASLKSLSRHERVTLFMTLLAGFQLLLHRYTGQEEIVVGSNIANRNRAETEGLIGFFVNNLVLRTDFSSNRSFRELLRSVRDTCLGAYAHQDLPFEKLIEELRPARDASYTPLFQVIFALHNAPVAPLKLAGLSLTPLEIPNRAARFDLMLNMRETEAGLVGALEHNTDLFNRSTITLLVSRFQTLLENIVENPDQEIESLSLTNEDESRQLIYAFNDELE